MSVISNQSAEHYTWGDNCDGWHLVKSDNLSIIQERVPSGGNTSQLSNQHQADLIFTVTSTPPAQGDRVEV